MTVNEFLIHKISQCNNFLIRAGEIAPPGNYKPCLFSQFNKLMDGAPMANTITGLMELNRDPAIVVRKEQFYKYKELKQIGAHKIEDINDRLQKGLKLLFSKNIGADLETQDETASIFTPNSESRRQIMEIDKIKFGNQPEFH